jgi:tRNA (cmo5U34)-methyltransferase
MKENLGSGDNIIASIGGWTFSKKNIAKNFEKHASKSIPYYQEGHDLICKLSDFFIKKKSTCYELGCSRGDLLKKLLKYSKKENVKFIGIDLEREMINAAKKNVKNIKSNNTIKFVRNNIVNAKLNKSDLIISYYTIQFINPRERQKIINKIFKSLNWGGAFIMFEKVRAKDARFQDYMTNIYHNFKAENGYSGSEIINKSNSLKGVMEPFSSNANLDMLRRSGFKDYMSIYKWVTFEGFLAIK